MYWTPICSKYPLKGSLKHEKISENGHFPGQLRPIGEIPQGGFGWIGDYSKNPLFRSPLNSNYVLFEFFGHFMVLSN